MGNQTKVNMELAPAIKQMTQSQKLPKSFYLGEDVVAIARQLLGKVLVSQIDGLHTAGIIVETEAYRGIEDRASHAFQGRKTERTAVMYQEGGRAYVYLIYGMYHLLNVVTNRAGIPDAVLIRALEPLEGIEHMLQRRKRHRFDVQLTNGPGKLTKALGISLEHYGTLLTGNLLWIEDRGLHLPTDAIVSGPRIGVDYAGNDAQNPWRFWVKANPFVSK